MAMCIDTDKGSLLLINGYFPNDSHSKSVIDPEFIEVCNEIESLIYGSKQKFIIIGGDINIDLCRNNLHTEYFKTFLERHQLISAWQHTGFPDFTYQGPTGSSCIDHFIVSRNVLNHFISASVDHVSINFSVHSPININLKMMVGNGEKNIESYNNDTCKVAWHRVETNHKDVYKQSLFNILNDITIPEGCKCENVNCTKSSHKSDIEEYCTQLIDACMEASKDLPRVKKKKRIPFWSTKIKPLKDDATFWRKIWIDCGKPVSGELYNIMKRTKLHYHYAVRRLKRNSETLRKEKMAESILNNKCRDFWTEVQKLKGTSVPRPYCVEDKDDHFEIASHFAEKYNNLYNSVPSDSSRIQKVKENVNRKISENKDFTDMKIDECDIRKAVKSLKSNKGDGENKLFSDHILYAPEIMLKCLSYLFCGMMVHGHTPDCLLKSTLVSIPKNVRGDLSSDENYRGISLCSSIFKLYEIVILHKQGYCLQTSDMQFAYKMGHSTTVSTLLLKDVVTHYLNNGSEVFCCFIDASKAFDRLRHDILFEMLLQKNVDPLIVKVIIDIYERQCIQTSWLGAKSASFSCSNGVRQGGILSPLLYAVYNDVLLQRLKDEGVGCWIANNYYGALSYADDLCILSPSVAGLRNMLHTCEIYGNEYDVLYNPTKTQCMKFSRENHESVNNIDMKLCGKSLSWVTSFKYLGNWICSNLSEHTEVSKKLGNFYGNVNNLCSSFKHVGFQSLYKLFNSYCCHYYGSQAWRLNDTNISRIYIAWNKAIRHICNVPNTTHTALLPYMVKCLYVKEQIFIRTVNMIKNMLKSPNVNINFMARNNMNNHLSIIGSNWYEISKYINVDILNCDVRSTLIKRMYENFSVENHIIYELLEISNGSKTLQNFCTMDIQEMLYIMCTS
jgi:hypothetical protein